MGGTWLVDGEHPKQLPAEVTLRIKRKLVKAAVVSCSGVDHDHGHRYQWSGIDFELKLETVIGIVGVSLRSLRPRFKVEIDV